MINEIFLMCCHLSFCLGLSCGVLFWWGVMR